MSTWTTNQHQILLDGSPFWIKGVAYSPVPAGAATGTPQVGDWFYSTGQTHTWDQIYQRDLPNMTANLGVNVLKTYFFWPWVPPADISTWQSVVSGPVRDHTPFLDACEKSGIYVLIGIALDAGNIFDNGDPTSGKDYLDFYLAVCKQLAESYGDHPAVMGFVVGNETNNPTRSQSQSYWDKNQQFAKAVKNNAPKKLCIQAFQNDPELFTYTIGASGTNVAEFYKENYDAWGMNVFNGSSFYPFWKNFNDNVVTPGYQIPLIITEFGVPAGTNDPVTETGENGASVVELPNNGQAAATCLRSLWKDMCSHSDLCAGGTYFEYCDEWWKGNGDSNCNHTTGSNSAGNAFPGKWWEPAWWGLYAIAPRGRSCADGPWDSTTNTPYPADTLTARATAGTMKELDAPSPHAEIFMYLTQGYGEGSSTVKEYLVNQIAGNNGNFIMTFDENADRDIRPSQLTFDFGYVYNRQILLTLTQGVGENAYTVTEYLNNQINTNGGRFTIDFPEDAAPNLRLTKLHFHYE